MEQLTTAVAIGELADVVISDTQSRSILVCESDPISADEDRCEKWDIHNE